MLDKPLIIKDWLRGMTVDPFSGFPQMRGLDPHKVPGSIALNRAPTALTGSTLGRIKWIRGDTSGYVYFLDSNGKLWRTTDYSTYSQITGNTTTSAHGNGLEFYKDSMIVVRDQLVDRYNISGAAWTSGIATLANSNTGYNPAFASQDDKLYIGNGRNVASMTDSSGTGFDNDALVIAQNFSVTCFEDLGDRLMIGSEWGSSSYASKIAKIFPWSRDSTESFSLPIDIADEGINALAADNNTLYISSGLQGRISVTNGVSAYPVARIPLDTREFPSQSVSTGSTWGIRVFPDGLEFFGDELLIGTAQTNAGGAIINPLGLYGLKNKAIRYMGTQSGGKDGSDGTQVEITAVYAVSPSEYFVAWATTISTVSTYGIDYISMANTRIASYGGYVYSPLFFVGSGLNKTTIDEFSVYLTKPLASGQGVKLSYRQDNSSSFTDFKTIDYATYGAITEYTFKYSIPNLTHFQLKVSLTSSDKLSPELAFVACH